MIHPDQFKLISSRTKSGLFVPDDLKETEVQAQGNEEAPQMPNRKTRRQMMKAVKQYNRQELRKKLRMNK